MAQDIFSNPLERSQQAARVDVRPLAERIFWWMGRPWNHRTIAGWAVVLSFAFPVATPLVIVWICLCGIALLYTGGSLPIRLPVQANRVDHSQTFTDDNERPIYFPAGGIFYIGTVRKVPGVTDEHVGEQLFVTNSDARTHFSFFGTTGAGKPQPYTSLVGTSDGWKKMGDIQVGDQVWTPDGSLAPVDAVFEQGWLDVFEVEFEDGRIVQASDEHIWQVAGDGRDQTTTIDLFHRMALPHDPLYVPLPQPWRDAPEVWEFDIGGKPYMVAHAAYKAGADAALPVPLLNASVNQRVHALRALMDFGGKVDFEHIEFHHASEKLCRQLAYLMYSVGGKAEVKPSEGQGWVVCIRHPDAVGLFSDNNPKQKKARLLPPCLPWLRIKAVRYIGLKPCRCIHVNHPDHLYVTDGFVVTHNTEAILSFCANPLAWGSGFILTDGKAEVITPNKVYALCRRVLREDDFRVLNFMNAGRDIWEIEKNEGRYSNSFNPAQRASSGQNTQLMASLMAEAGSDPMWKGLAVGMIDAVNRALKYKQFKGKIEIDFTIIRDSIDLEAIIDLCAEFDPVQRNFPELDPSLVFKPLKAYLLNLPGFDWKGIMEAPKGKRKIPEDLNKQHNFRSMQFMRQLTMLCDTYGPIFRHQYPEVDMEDVVRMRRVLVVLLPSLGMSDEESEAVGKLVITALRMMMAKTLGDKIEGTYEELNESRPTASPAPFLTIMDEIGYYFAMGISVMYAQARSLGFSMMAAGQTLAPIYKDKIKHEAKGMLANAGCTFCGLMKDPDETAEYFVKLAGEAVVAESSGHEGGVGGYLDQLRTSSRVQKRLEYAELASMKEGESVLVWKNKLIRVKNFYVFGKAKIPKKAPMLLNKMAPIVAPKIGDIEHCILRTESSRSLDNSLANAILKDSIDFARGGTIEAPARPTSDLFGALLKVSEAYEHINDVNTDTNARIIALLQQVDTLLNPVEAVSIDEQSSGAGGTQALNMKSTEVEGAGDIPLPGIETLAINPVDSLMNDFVELSDNKPTDPIEVATQAAVAAVSLPTSGDEQESAESQLASGLFDDDLVETQIESASTENPMAGEGDAGDTSMLATGGSVEQEEIDLGQMLDVAIESSGIVESISVSELTDGLPEVAKEYLQEVAKIVSPDDPEQGLKAAEAEIKEMFEYQHQPDEVPVETDSAPAKSLEDELSAMMGI